MEQKICLVHVFSTGLIFQVMDLPCFEVLPVVVGSSFSRACAGWLPILTTNYVSVGVAGNVQCKLRFRTLTAVAKTVEGLDTFSSKDESIHISSKSFLLL